MKRLYSLVLITFLGVASSAQGAAHSGMTTEAVANHVQERNINDQFKTPLTGFFLTCAQGSASDVQAALQNGADPGKGDPDHGQMPPLAMAAGNNPDPAVIALLIKAGAHVNQQGQVYGRSPLHQAVLFNPNGLAVVKALLEHKADIYAQDIRDNTALDYAIDGTVRNDHFDGTPREDMMLLLLQSASSAVYPHSRTEMKDFYTRKYKRYAAAFAHGRNGGKLNPKVVAAFKSLGVDVNVNVDKGARVSP